MRYKAPVRIDFAGEWTDVSHLIQGKVGHVSNVTISPLAYLEKGNLSFPYPRGSGLATSTSIKLLEIIQFRKGRDYLKQKTLEEIAEELFILENKELGWMIGRQDQYSIVFGGYNCFRFEGEKVTSLPFNISEDVLKKLEKRILLVYSGNSRNMQDVTKRIYENYNTGEEKYRESLDKISECGLNFSVALEKGDLDECGKIISENWEAKKQLASNISNKKIEAVYDFALSNGAIGGNLCGAGGGGCFVFCTHDKESLKNKIREKFPDCFDIDFRFEMRNIKELNSL